jgi:regulator of replication initiation timing
MKHILQVLEDELARRKKGAKQMWDKHNSILKENERLVNENKSLRNDLFQLSLNHFKNKENAEEKNYGIEE